MLWTRRGATPVSLKLVRLGLATDNTGATSVCWLFVRSGIRCRLKHTARAGMWRRPDVRNELKQLSALSLAPPTRAIRSSLLCQIFAADWSNLHCRSLFIGLAPASLVSGRSPDAVQQSEHHPKLVRVIITIFFRYASRLSW